MQIFYVFYLTLVTYLLATTMPEAQGRWLALSRDIVSLISYAHSTTPVGVDACWPSSFGIDGTCHPLDLLIIPTPTVVPSTPATRTVSAVAASPIPFNPVSYKDVFAEQFEITRAPRNRKNSKPTQRGTPCGVELAHLLDLLSTVASTMIIVQLLTVLGQPAVRYLESPGPITPIPNDLEFHPPTVLLDGCYTLIPSWISTASSLIHADSIAYIHNNDGVSLKELPLWGLYFATILVRSCSKPVVSTPPPPTETRVAWHRLPLMIEASASEAAKLLSICWFQSHSLPGSSSGLDSKVQPLKLKGKLNSLPPVLELTPSIQLQAQDAAHLPASSTTNSLHLAVHVDNIGSEITGPNQPGNPASSFLPETWPPTRTELSHQHSPPGVSEPPLVRSFEKISGRRVTPLIQLEYGQTDGVSQVRSSLSLLKVISMDSLLPGEYDLGFLSQFPAPPEKVPVRPHSLPGKLDMRTPFLKSPPWPSQDSIPDSQEVQPMRHLPILFTPGSTASLTSPARKERRGFSIYCGPVSQRSAQVSPSMVMDAEPASGPRSDTETISQESSPVPNIRLSISSASSRWSLFAKKSKRKLRKVSSLFASSNSLSNLHEKMNAFPKTSSHQTFNKSKRLPELPGPPFNGNASKTYDS